jgi:hypothetical protein
VIFQTVKKTGAKIPTPTQFKFTKNKRSHRVTDPQILPRIHQQVLNLKMGQNDRKIEVLINKALEDL